MNCFSAYRIERVLEALDAETCATLDAAFGPPAPLAFQAYGRLAPLVVSSPLAVEECRNELATENAEAWLKKLPHRVRLDAGAKAAFHRLIGDAQRRYDRAMEAYVEMRRKVGRGG